jgi:hypothetical protein
VGIGFCTEWKTGSGEKGRKISEGMIGVTSNVGLVWGQMSATKLVFRITGIFPSGLRKGYIC